MIVYASKKTEDAVFLQGKCGILYLTLAVTGSCYRLGLREAKNLG
jgi:hypothetical protein